MGLLKIFADLFRRAQLQRFLPQRTDSTPYLYESPTDEKESISVGNKFVIRGKRIVPGSAAPETEKPRSPLRDLL